MLNKTHPFQKKKPTLEKLESLITIFFIKRNDFIEGNDLLDMQRLIYFFFLWHLILPTQIVERSENSWKCFKGLKILSNNLVFPLTEEVYWKERERATSVDSSTVLGGF